MRPLKSHFPDHALTTLDTLLKQTKEAWVVRRAQAVREVVVGHHINAVSAAFHVANSALRKWVQRFAQEGPQGLRDRPRSRRPPTNSPVSWHSTASASLSKPP
jgi:Helix-turn-helix domain